MAFLRRLTDLDSPSAEWQREWNELLVGQGVRRTIPLCVSAETGPALCLLPSGYALLVPRTLWTSLAAKQRRAILGHELAHYRRGDLWKSLLARAVALPHWFNPLAWYAVRRLDECAEWACDDAAAASSDVRSYAETLLQLNDGPGAVASAAVRGGRLYARIRRLLTNRRLEDSIMKKIALVASILVLTLAGLVRPELTNEVLAGSPPEGGSPAATRLDLYGDSLPAGAVARLGTTRFRVAAMEEGVGLTALTFIENPKSIATFKHSYDSHEFIWWDAASGKVLRRIPVGDGNSVTIGRFGQPVETPRFAVTPDGKFAVTVHEIVQGRGVWTIRLTWWDLSSGQQLLFSDIGAATPDHYEVVDRIAIAPDGSKAVSAGRPDGRVGQLRIWERTGPGAIARVPGRIGMVRDLAFAPDGKSVVYCTEEGVVYVWDTSPPGTQWSVAMPLQFSPAKMATSRNGKTLAVAGRSGNVCLIELDTGKLIRTLRSPENVESIVFSADDKQLAVCIAVPRDYVAVWDVASGKVLHVLRPGHTPPLGGGGLVFSADGRFLAVGGHYVEDLGPEQRKAPGQRLRRAQPLVRGRPIPRRKADCCNCRL